MLGNIFNDAVSTIGVNECIISILVSIVLGCVISLTHKLTTKTTFNFLMTLALLPLLIHVVIFLINGNLGTSLAVAGAFSLIRFRSMPGNSKEILSVFWAMTIGLALGMGYVFYSVVITIVVAVVLLILNLFSNKFNKKSHRMLKIVIPENLDYEEVFDVLFDKYTDKVELRKVKTTNMGSMYELNYFVSIKDNVNEKQFIDDIRCRNGNMLVMLQREECEVEL